MSEQAPIDEHERDRPVVYLAGPVKERSDSGRAWRETVSEKWEDVFDVRDPLDKYGPGDGNEQWSPQRIVSEDLKLIDEADALLVRYDGGETWGTPMEVRYAVSQGTPAYLAWTAGSDLSPWAETHATAVRPSVTSACIALKAWWSTGDRPAHLNGVLSYSADEDIAAAADGGEDSAQTSDEETEDA